MTTATTLAELQAPHVARTGRYEESPRQNRPWYFGCSGPAFGEHSEMDGKKAVRALTGAATVINVLCGTSTSMGALPLGHRLRFLSQGGHTVGLPDFHSFLSREWLERSIDPLDRYINERVRATLNLLRAYSQRIDELRGYGLEDDISLNEASENDFWRFIGSSGFTRRAGVVMMDNGNLRAVWKGADSSHLALHFLGDQLIRYVIFKRRAGSRHISRVAGTDTFEGIKKQVQSFQLAELVKG